MATKSKLRGPYAHSSSGRFRLVEVDTRRELWFGSREEALTFKQASNGESTPVQVPTDHDRGSAAWWVGLLSSAAESVASGQGDLGAGRCLAALAGACARHRDDAEQEERLSELERMMDERVRAEKVSMGSGRRGWAATPPAGEQLDYDRFGSKVIGDDPDDEDDPN